MPAYLNCMQEIAIDYVEFCLDKFRKDIDEYRPKKRVTWKEQSEVAQISDEENDEGQKVKRKCFENLRDNEDSRKDWRAGLLKAKI